jgi:ferredoxin
MCGACVQACPVDAITMTRQGAVIDEDTCTAAALSLKHALPPRRVDRVELQKQLLANGGDLARKMRRIPDVTGPVG